MTFTYTLLCHKLSTHQISFTLFYTWCCAHDSHILEQSLYRKLNHLTRV